MRGMLFSAIAFIGLFLSTGIALAIERNVPSEYSTIQAAIDASNNGDVIIIATGTYTGAGNRDIDFSGKAITVRSTNSQDPCIVAATIIDCQGSGRGFSFHSGEENSSIVSGLTIKNGYVSNAGGGIYCSGASPTIENCAISNCVAYGSAGSDMWCSPSSGCSGTLTNGGHAYGGGIFSDSGSNPNINNCIITNNSASGGVGGILYESGIPAGGAIGGDARGGGIYSASTTIIENCRIIGNTATGAGGGGNSGNGYGGGIQSNGTIKNCLIADNVAIGDEILYLGPPVANQEGGGILTDNSYVSNCTVRGNICYRNESDGIRGTVSTVITNCIIWNNSEDDLYGCSATYSCISDLNDNGTGVIHGDPCFVPGPQGNYYLSQIAAGQAVNSPCVNAGSDTVENLNMNLSTTRTDALGDTGIVDMGYHYPTNYGSPDLNKDAFIDFFDYGLLANNWLLSPDPCDPNSGDIIKDNQVDIYDLAQLVKFWLNCLVTSAFNPQPADNATDISRNVVLRWSPGENTVSHDVYFGTRLNEIYDANTSSAQFMGNQDVNYWDTNTFSPDGLDANKIYYWRIDEAGPACETKGAVWRFTTVPLPPGQAYNPVPIDGATEVGITADLIWSSGSFTTSHDVYFGTTNPPPFKVNQTGTTYDTGTMDTNTTYYWRIDEKNESGTTTGNIWIFKTIILPPEQAVNPIPGNATINIILNQDLSWTAGNNTKSHDVYFGTTNPPPFIGNQTGTTYDTGTMDINTTYYWRIDEKNESGTTSGVLWSFRTGSEITITLLQDGFETNFDKWNDNGVTDWSLDMTRHSGSYAAYAGPQDNDLISDNLDTSNLYSIKIEFWYWDAGVFVSDNVYLQYYNGSTYDNIINLGNSTEYQWNLFTSTILKSTNPQYFRSNFRIKFAASGIGLNRYLCIDDVNITGQQILFPAPGAAFNPIPENEATDINLTQPLTWSAGNYATSHDVYFGTINPPPFIVHQTGTTYNGTMDTNTTYYWRIDEKNTSGTTIGNLWSFTTISQPPGQASNPSPVDGAANVSIAKDINWTSGSLAASHDVYFGTSNPPPFKVNQSGTYYDTGLMNANTTYYWRIDEKNSNGTATGNLWSFTTNSMSEVNDANLVAWWKLDETNGTIANDSKGTNNGTVYGGATWTTGKINGSLSFNGTSNYVDCGIGPSNYDNITVSAWMQTSTNGVLVSNRYNSSSYGTWYTLSSTGIELGGNGSGVGYMNLTFNTTTLDGLWHHVVYTKNGTSHAIYVDGSPDQQFTSNADISWAVPLYIGKRWNKTNSISWFNGIIDDVRIYNLALTAEEVALLFQQAQ